MATYSTPHSQPGCSTATIVHLPLAPQVVARTRFSPPPPSRDDCLTIAEAMAMLDQAMTARGGTIMMAAITGPGDPLATAGLTLEAIRLIRLRYPQLQIGLRTMGISSDGMAADLARSGVCYIEMEVEAVRADIIEKIFAWIRPAAKTLKIGEAADLLIREQRNGLSALVFHGIRVAIRTTLYPGCNIDHVARVSADMMELGADTISLLPYTPEAGAEVNLATPDPETIAEAVSRASRHLAVVEPLLNRPSPAAAKTDGVLWPWPTRERPNIAIASSNGVEVDLHLGQTIAFLIYGPREDGLICMLGKREAPKAGTGLGRWHKVAALLRDCCALAVASAGESPRLALAEAGLTLFVSEGNIEEMVDRMYDGCKKIKRNM